MRICALGQNQQEKLEGGGGIFETKSGYTVIDTSVITFSGYRKSEGNVKGEDSSLSYLNVFDMCVNEKELKFKALF